jgi:predicted DsbA family dithiol-disulfide isomerase
MPMPEDRSESREEVTEGEEKLIEYIAEKVGLDRKTIREVLKAEKTYWVLQVERALRGGNP